MCSESKWSHWSHSLAWLKVCIMHRALGQLHVNRHQGISHTVHNTGDPGDASEHESEITVNVVSLSIVQFGP